MSIKRVERAFSRVCADVGALEQMITARQAKLAEGTTAGTSGKSPEERLDSARASVSRNQEKVPVLEGRIANSERRLDALREDAEAAPKGERQFLRAEVLLAERRLTRNREALQTCRDRIERAEARVAQLEAGNVPETVMDHVSLDRLATILAAVQAAGAFLQADAEPIGTPEAVDDVAEAEAAAAADAAAAGETIVEETVA